MKTTTSKSKSTSSFSQLASASKPTKPTCPPICFELRGFSHGYPKGSKAEKGSKSWVAVVKELKPNPERDNQLERVLDFQKSVFTEWVGKRKDGFISDNFSFWHLAEGAIYYCCILDDDKQSEPTKKDCVVVDGKLEFLSFDQVISIFQDGVKLEDALASGDADDVSDLEAADELNGSEVPSE